MLCVTLTLADSVPAAIAEQTVDQLVGSLSAHPDAIGGPVTGFQATGQRQVQGCLASAAEAVGFILSAARSATWGLHLAVFASHSGSGTPRHTEAEIRRVLELASAAGPKALRAPGGVRVELVRDEHLFGAKDAPEVGPIESALQLVCAIERRRSDEGQEAGLMINAGKSQTKAAVDLGVSQQAVSSRLQAGYWYESRKVAYWLALQIEQLIGK